MPKRKVLPADLIDRRSFFLPEKVRYDWMMQQAAVSEADLPTLVTEAMIAIEEEFEPLFNIFETTVDRRSDAPVQQRRDQAGRRLFRPYLRVFSRKATVEQLKQAPTSTQVVWLEDPFPIAEL